MKKIETPYDALTYKIIGLAMAIHNELGPGFPEEIYHRAMIVGLTVDGVPHVTEFEIEISFRGQTIGKFELDLVADQKVIVELKAVSALAPIHEQQVIAYLAASGLPVGLLINFGAAKLEFKRLFPPKAVQSSTAYQARQSKSSSA